MTQFTTSSIVAAAAVALSALAALSNTPVAQTYPSKPVRFIVPFGAGGPSDLAARIVAEPLSKWLGQPVVIENKPGADGLLATQAVRSAPPDGHTLLFSGASMVPLSTVKNLPGFDPVTDLAAISQITRLEWAMYVSADVPASSMAEFIAYARGNADKLSYASVNLLEDSIAAQIMKAIGTRMVRVPYKGLPPALSDLMAGRVQVKFGPVSGSQAYTTDRRVRMLAVLQRERSRFAADVPSLAEAGMPEISVPQWQGVFAPAKTPREIIDRLNRDINRTLNDPEVRAQFDRQSVQVEASTAEALAAIVEKDVRAWKEFVHETGLAQK